MAKSDSLQSRGTALENQFFANLDAKLLDELKAKQDHSNAIQEFRRITSIQDDQILEAIYKLGVTPQSLAAIRVFPLVAVAWADGRLDDSERLTVNTIASTHFLDKTSPSGKLLETWLESAPSAEMFEAWEAFARAMVASLSASEADDLKAAIIKEIHAVAEASGGLLGWASVSKGENETMKRIEAALTQPA